MDITKFKYFIFICVIGFSSVRAQTKLASVFGDHMVLQRNSNVQIWGTDNANVTIEITGSWGQTVKTKSNSKGKWKTSLKTIEAGGPYILKVNGTNKVVLEDVLLGEVWLCGGQSNMAMKLRGGPGQHIEGGNEMILNSKNQNLRFFTVQKAISDTPEENCVGDWQKAQPKTSAEFSAVAYSFGLRLQKYLNVPVGLISSNVGGTPAQAWISKEIITSEFPEFNTDFSKERNTKSATVLYNGMINPLVPFTIKGAIWYQGEANRWDAEQYSRLFPAMIRNWRTSWSQGDFPFYFVQLAPYGPGKEEWVELQLAQLKTMLTVSNTGMAVINDIGYKTRIHPPKKKEVGERLALWALTKDYNVEGVLYSGPIYKSIEINKDKILVSFNEAPLGLSSLGKTLNDFEISGEDGIYHPAKAKIIERGMKLQLWNENIKIPKHVRYAWRSYVEGSLFNTAGLPASSFSSEEWSDILKKKK